MCLFWVFPPYSDILLKCTFTKLSMIILVCFLTVLTCYFSLSMIFQVFCHSSLNDVFIFLRFFFFTYWSRLFTLCSAKSVLPVIDHFVWDLSLMNLNSFWTYSTFKLFRLLEVSPGINFHSLTVPQPCRMTFPFGTFFPFPFLPFPAWRAQAPMLVFRRNLSPLLYAGTRNT